MRFGLIGETLGHSFSPQIHAELGSVPYELRPLPPGKLKAFLRERAFEGINVTIPYKQAVIPYLDRIDPSASAVGAVNTVVREADGTLSGYNTDLDGMLYALLRAGIEPAGKKAVILGSGGTAHTALAVLRKLRAAEIVIVSRDPSAAGRAFPEAAVSGYDALYTLHADAEILINTTPVGMYPGCGVRPAVIGRLPRLSGVMDVIYNPLRTALIADAEAAGIPSTNGLPMLVAQARAAAEHFLGRAIPDGENERILAGLWRSLRNIVLIGMPGSGKSTIGQLLAEQLGRPFLDLDRCIEEDAGMSIPELFAQYGEKHFRDLETEAAKKYGARTGCVIATGGGIVLRKENYLPLHQNGTLFRLLRDPAKLPLDGRPLSGSSEAVLAMARQREPFYRLFADAAIDNSGLPEETAAAILAAADPALSVNPLSSAP